MASLCSSSAIPPQSYTRRRGILLFVVDRVSACVVGIEPGRGALGWGGSGGDGGGGAADGGWRGGKWHAVGRTQKTLRHSRANRTTMGLGFRV